MTPELRQQIVHARTASYTTIMATTVIGFALIGGAMHLGDGSYSAPFMMLTIMLTAFGILAGNTALDDIANLAQDMTDEIKATTYGQAASTRDFGKLKTISTALIGLTGLATVLALVL